MEKGLANCGVADAGEEAIERVFRATVWVV